MSYTYEQRTSPKERSRQKPERAAESAPLQNIVTAGQAAAPAGGGSPNLEAVMRERMRGTFGDLSAVREVTSRTPEAPVRETAAPAPYTGSVTHALSGASPSPAAAGPMQAKRETKEEKLRRKEASRDVDELYRLENGMKTDLSDDERQAVNAKYDEILGKGTNLELLREVHKRREKHLRSLAKKHNKETGYTREKKDRELHPEKYQGAGKIKPGDDEYRARFFGAWDDDAMDVGTYGQLTSLISGNGMDGDKAFSQYKKEAGAAERKKSKKLKDLEARGAELYGGMIHNPMMKSEEGAPLVTQFKAHHMERADNIFRRKK